MVQASAWSWFVHNGGIQAIIVAIVGIVIAGLLHVTVRLLRIAVDLLNTHTPGGLGDVLAKLERTEPPSTSADRDEPT